MSDPLWQAIVLLLVAVVFVQGFVLLGVMRQLGGVLIQLRPARIGALEDQGPIVGEMVDVSDLEQRPAIVLFVSPNCTLCKPLLPALPAIDRSYPDLYLSAVVIGGSEGEVSAYAARLGPRARQDLTSLETKWRVPGTPFAVGVDRHGNIHSSGAVNSLDQLESLAEALVTPQNDGSHSRDGEDAVPTLVGLELQGEPFDDPGVQELHIEEAPSYADGNQRRFD